MTLSPSEVTILCFCVFKEQTLIGRPDAPQQQDIQLNGLGVLPEHAVIHTVDNDVFITPCEGAR